MKRSLNCVSCGKHFITNQPRAMSCSGRCNLKQWRARHSEHNRQIKRKWRRRNGVLEHGSPEHRKKQREQFHYSGSSHPAWKGGGVGYRALHRWVERHMGKPDKCSMCGGSGLVGRQIHWSNISGNYYRRLSDWQRLCSRCHAQYDKSLKERVAI